MAEGLDWDSDEYDADPEAFKQKYKSMVTYEKGGRGSKKDKMDDRGIGLGHDSYANYSPLFCVRVNVDDILICTHLYAVSHRWGDGKKGKGKTVRIVKDGHEADSEGEGESVDALSVILSCWQAGK